MCHSAQLRSIERALRKDNAIIQGLLIGGDPVEMAAKFIRTTLNLDDVEVLDAFWLGRAADDGSRRKCPLLVRFRSVRAKRSAQQKCRAVRPPGVYVDDDLAVDERNERAKKYAEKKNAENPRPSNVSFPTTASPVQRHPVELPSPAAPSSPPGSSTTAPAPATHRATETGGPSTPLPRATTVGRKTKSVRRSTPPQRAAKKPRRELPRPRLSAAKPLRKPKAPAAGFRAYFALATTAAASSPDNARYSHNNATTAPAPVLSPAEVGCSTPRPDRWPLISPSPPRRPPSSPARPSPPTTDDNEVEEEEPACPTFTKARRQRPDVLW